jgi:C4-dicarboxylate-specific signal transduction histidine kinase
VFLVVAVVTSYLTTARKRAEEELRQAHAELEERVRQRTAELTSTNESLRTEIVERKRAENEIWRLQLEMGRVERLATLGRMTGTIAHELGTPLNSVLGYTQLLSQENLPERAQRRLAIIENQIHRMGDIIQHYLSHSRRSAPKTRIDVNDLVRETLLLLQPILQQHGMEVTTTLAESLPPLFGDGVSLQRVLINLLDNAVDASEEKGRIKISTRLRLAPGGKASGIAIEIADNGAGIPPEILPKIFDLFVTTKPPGKGTGLGLVICQEIIKAHGGVLNVSSRVGYGTTVQIFLPADTKPAECVVSEEGS